MKSVFTLKGLEFNVIMGGESKTTGKLDEVAIEFECDKGEYIEVVKMITAVISEIKKDILH